MLFTFSQKSARHSPNITGIYTEKAQKFIILKLLSYEIYHIL